MIKQEYLKIVRRRGLFLTAVILTTVVAIAVIVMSLVVHGSKPQEYTGGKELLEDFTGAIVLPAVVFAILMGAQTGAWDMANGTFRYMAMTGRPRMELYAVRLPALIAAILAFVGPAMAIAVVGSLALPLEDFTAVTTAAILDFVWELMLVLATYSLVSMAIGALLRSIGAAIAVSLVLNLIGLNLLAALDSVNETLGDLMLPNVIGRLTGGDSSVSIALAATALIVWLGAFLGAGALRTVRAEY
ncbi:MAG: hypothetical protein WDZ37_02510 [Solirubrobacterales bacterium]